MRNLFHVLAVAGLLVGGLVGLAGGMTGCADSSAQLNRPAPYRPTAAPAATQSPDFAAPKKP